MANSKLVYSTSGDNQCRRCGKALQKCRCDIGKQRQQSGDGTLKIQRETKGRGGKEVTVISGFILDADELKVLAKRLKASCGTGGSVKDGTIEIQGDHRNKLQQLLEQSGYKTKLSGG